MAVPQCELPVVFHRSKDILRSDPRDGAVVAGKRNNFKRRRWETIYALATRADMEALRDEINARAGSVASFDWDPPDEGATTFRARFEGPEFEWSWSGADVYAMNATLVQTR